MISITRREAICLAGTAAAAVVARPMAVATQVAPRPLPIPPLLEPGKEDRTVSLAVARTMHRFGAGPPVAAYGISSSYLGPVVRVRAGESVRLQVENRLNEPTTMHWHGLLIPSEFDGGPHNPIAAGAVWSPEVAIRQAPATTWFHPHLHQDTGRQTYLGLAGLLVVTDGGDRERGLPSQYGIDDLPIIIQDRRFGTDGSHAYAPDMMDLMHGFRGDRIIVNGVEQPVASVPRGLVRLRLLNGANARNFDLYFDDRRTFHVIAGDAGFLRKPVEASRLVIAPGERYELLVNFSDGRRAELRTGADDNGRFGPDMMDRLRRVISRLMPRTDSVMVFQPDDRAGTVLKVPDRLDDPGSVDPAGAIRRRAFAFDEMLAANMPKMMQGMNDRSGSMARMPRPAHGEHEARSAEAAGPILLPANSGLVMGINGRTFAMDRIDVEANLGSAEIWEITSQEMAHPFHIHGAHFRVLSKGGVSPPAREGGWKDVVLVEKRAEIFVRFTQPASREKPFMFHCHNLEHEDLGMMWQYTAA